jgi:hypothetical protein
LWAVLFIFLVQLMGGLLLDYRWPQIRFPAAARVLAKCPCQPQGPLVVTLGSSRFDGGILEGQVTQELRKGTGEENLLVVNLAVGCGDLIVAEHIYTKLRAQGIKPTQVVLEVSPETLNDRNVWLDQHAYRQLTWEDTLGYAKDLMRSGHFVRFWRSRLFPLYIHRDQLQRHAALAVLADQKSSPALRQTLLAPPVKEDDLRWPDPRMRHDPTLRTQAGLDNIRTWLKQYHIGGTPAASLERILKACARDGIPVLLVGVPVTKAHRDLYRPEIEAAFLQHMEETLHRHHHVRFVDYRSAIPDTGFTDNHHLTLEGAQQFSRLLTEKVLLPELRTHLVTSSIPSTEKARAVARGP